MSLKRFRYEVEGIDEEDVQLQLDNAFLEFAKAAHKIVADTVVDDGGVIQNFECTDEHVHAIKRNGLPLMYGRRVFRLIERKEDDNGN